MKSQHFAIMAGSLLLIALVLLLSGGSPTGSADKATLLPARVVTVTGEGEVRVKPDQAQVTVGVWTHGASATDAEALNVAFVRQVQAAMVNAGADGEQVEVTQSAMGTATYQDATGAARISGFETRSTIRVTVGNLNRVQATVDAALAAGATSLEGITYTLENPEQAKQAAMKQALANARARAGSMVKAEGEKLGDLRDMEVLLEDAPTANSQSAGTLLFRAQVRTTFEY